MVFKHPQEITVNFVWDHEQSIDDGRSYKEVVNIYETYNLWPLLLPFRVGGIGVWSDRPPSRLLVPHPSTLLPL